MQTFCVLWQSIRDLVSELEVDLPIRTGVFEGISRHRGAGYESWLVRSVEHIRALEIMTKRFVNVFISAIVIRCRMVSKRTLARS